MESKCTAKVVLPNEFKELASESIGNEIAAKLFSAIEQGEEFTSVRLNTSKILNIESSDFKDNILDKVKWCSSGYYLKERPQFTLDPLFHAGGYYVQEACSMYMDLIKCTIEKEVGQDAIFFNNNLSVLDLCAAPGGKTTHLLSLIGDNSLLVSNEVIRSRATILADNVAKWGAKNVIVTNNDPKEFTALRERFHLVVVDAPCSGEGLFRRDNEAVSEWSLANVKLCCERQRRILSDIWPALKPGGFMVYSTCTYNHLENDDNVNFIKQELGAEIVEIDLPTDSGIIRTCCGGIQFVPGLVKGEGQFVALVQKPFEKQEKAARYDRHFCGKYGDKHDEKYNAKQKKYINKDKPLWNKICELGHLTTLSTVPLDLVKGYPMGLLNDILFFERNLKPVLSGIAMGTIKGKDCIPHADLALCSVVYEAIKGNILFDGLYVVEVSRENALKFLAKEQLAFEGKPNGYLLLTYNGLGLGFVKNLGNRSNNLLPMARRIRMSINN